MPDPTTHRPRLGRRYALVALLFIVGVVLGPGILITTVFLTLSKFGDATKFDVPGGIDFRAEKAGRFIIWDETSGTIGNRSHASTPALPSGITVQVTQRNGAPIDVSPADGTTYTSGRTERRSVFRFDAPSTGEYHIQAAGDIAPRVFAVSPDAFGKAIGAILVAACSGFLGFGMMMTAMVLLVLTIVAHVRAGSRIT